MGQGILKKKNGMINSDKFDIYYGYSQHKLICFFFFLSLSTSLSSSKPQIKIIIGNKTKYLYKQKNRINPKKKKIVTKG